MKTIFSDIKIIDPNATTQQNSLKNIPIIPQIPLRLSLSPQKPRQSKKFFFPVRNKSTKNDQCQAKKQLEALLMRQKIILMAQRTHMNDLLIPSELFLRQKQLVVFPSLEVKRMGQNQVRPPASRRLKERNEENQFRLQDIRKEYHSNILGSPSLECTDNTNPISWTSERKIQSPQQIRKSVVIPKINKKTIVVEIIPKAQKQQKTQKPDPQIASPSPSIMSRIRSQAQIQSNINSQSTTKKYKKGYLYYAPGGGAQYWNKIKSNIDNPAKISVNNKGLTAKIYFCLDISTLQPITFQRENQDIQIASLSKIMTCYLALLISRKYQVDLKQVSYRVPDWITQIPGTSAQLEAGDVVSAYDLLFALMLPSGNDASVCLAEIMGKIIQRHRKYDQKKSYLQTFIAHMNAFSKELDLPQQWGNSSGLSSNPNFSTAKAIVALATLALKDETFCKVINTQQHEVGIKNDRYGLCRKRNWRNTNKLLERGWQGVKTGTTESAGHCLMALRGNLLVGVFDCQTLSKRFSDAIRLSDFILAHPQ